MLEHPWLRHWKELLKCFSRTTQYNCNFVKKVKAAYFSLWWIISVEQFSSLCKLTFIENWVLPGSYKSIRLVVWFSSKASPFIKSVLWFKYSPCSPLSLQDHISVPYQPDSSSNPSSTTSSTPSSPAPPLPSSATPPSPLHPSPQSARQQKQFNLTGIITISDEEFALWSHIILQCRK